MRASPVLLSTAAVALVLAAGCSSGSQMMGRGGRSGSSSMMGGNQGAMPGYRYSTTTCAAPKATGTTVNVQLADMGLTSMMGGTSPMGAHMMLRSTSATVRAGTVTLITTNRGWRTHELVILPLTAGATAGHRVAGRDGKVPETGALGEASTPCGSGAGTGTPAGSRSWVTLTLPAGRYELVCNLPNHYADGMYQEFDVTAP